MMRVANGGRMSVFNKSIFNRVAIGASICFVLLTARTSSAASRLLITDTQLKDTQKLFEIQDGNSPDAAAPSAATLVTALTALERGSDSTKCVDNPGHPKALSSGCQSSNQIPGYSFIYNTPAQWNARSIGDEIALLAFGSLIDTQNANDWAAAAEKWLIGTPQYPGAANYPIWDQPLSGSDACTKGQYGSCVSDNNLLQRKCTDGTDITLFEYPDLATAQLLFGVSVADSWLSQRADYQANKATVEDAIAKHARQMYCRASTAGEQIHDQVLQNHLWIANTGLAAAGYALQSNPTYRAEAKQWIALAKTNYASVLKSLWNDGSDHEGAAYWDYGVPFMYRFFDLVSSQEGCQFIQLTASDTNPCALPAGFNTNDFENAVSWFKNTGSYRIAVSMPWLSNATLVGGGIFPSFPIPKPASSTATFGQSYVIDLADSYRTMQDGATLSPSVLRRLARDYDGGDAQNAAIQMEPLLTKSGAKNFWLDFLWYGAHTSPVPEQKPDSSFNDLGLRVNRSTVSNNLDTSILTFSYGPPLSSKQAMQSCSKNLGSAHAHLAAGSFSLSFSSSSAYAGAYLIRNPGYSAKYSGLENTLTVDSIGQNGENADWTQWTVNAGASATAACQTQTKLLFAGGESSDLPGVTVESADLTGAYPSASSDSPAAGAVSKFTRTLLYFKNENALLVFDHIVPPSKPVGNNFELRFHTDYPPKKSAKTKNGSAMYGWTQPLSSSVPNSSNQFLQFEFNPLTPDAQYAKTYTGVRLSSNISTYSIPTSSGNYHEYGILAYRSTDAGEWNAISAITWGTPSLTTVSVVPSSSTSPYDFVIQVGGKKYQIRERATSATGQGGFISLAQ